MSQPCYLPDGGISANDRPCNQNAAHSACCPSSDECLSNNYCFDGQVITRGTCTDSNFKDPSCPSLCKDVVPDGGCVLFPTVTDKGFQFCCSGIDDQSQQCALQTNGSGDPFSLPPAKIITNRATGETGPLNGSAAATVTATASAGSGSDSNGKVTAVGAGVGAPLGVLLLAAVVLLLLQTRRFSRLNKQYARERAEFWNREDLKSTQGLDKDTPLQTGPHELSELNSTPVSKTNRSAY